LNTEIDASRPGFWWTPASAVLTRSVWEGLGLKPMGEMELVSADGTAIRRGVSEAVLELPGYGERRTPVVPGESEDLLGAVTLEIFGPVLDSSGGSCGPLGR